MFAAREASPPEPIIGIPGQGSGPRKNGSARRPARAVNGTLSRHRAVLDQAVAENEELIGDTRREQEAHDHLQALRDKAAAKREMDAEAAEQRPPTPSHRPRP